MADLWTLLSEPGRLGAVLGLLVGCCLLRDVGRVILSIFDGARRARYKAQTHRGKQYSTRKHSAPKYRNPKPHA